MTAEIRWKQRYSNYKKALAQLRDGAGLAKERPLTRLEEQGLIQGFEFTHELAWLTLKDYLEGEGGLSLYGSKDTTREAFKSGLLINGDVWMDMITSRNLTSHTYNEVTARKIAEAILNEYIKEFDWLESAFSDLSRSNHE